MNEEIEVRYEKAFLLSPRVARHWKRFPREGVGLPSLEVFKCGLGEHLAGMI